ncbi:Uncharacterised protein [Yersinia mollaretii]|nr:Uncharacterised protein [Yersinia mollaretii]
MTFTIEGKRFTGLFIYGLLWINAVIGSCFSKKILLSANFLLIGITKSGKKTHLNKLSHK